MRSRSLNDRPAHRRAALRLAQLLCWVALLAAGTTAFGEPAPKETLLSNERWFEPTWGVSLNPPLGTTLSKHTPDKAIIRIIGPQLAYAIEGYIKQSSQPLDIVNVARKAIEQVGLAAPSSRLLEEKRIEPDGHPGAKLYFMISGKKGGKRILGQAMVLIDRRTLLLLQLKAPESHYDQVKVIFDAVIDTVQFQDPKERDRIRAQQIESGEQWLKNLDRKLKQLPLFGEQWYRIVDPVIDRGRVVDMDVGFVLEQQARDVTFLGQRGIAIDVYARFFIGQGEQRKRVMETISSFFLSDDRQDEIWFVMTTERPMGSDHSKDGVLRRFRQKRPKREFNFDNININLLTPDQRKALFGPQLRPALPEETRYVETGVRSRDQITVVIEQPSVRKPPLRWNKPKKGYLSQVEVQLLGRLLSGHKEQDMGFYAYYPSTAKISYRYVKVKPGKDGAYEVYVRPSPEQPEQISTYDARGRLINRQLTGGRSFIPTTEAKMKALWGLRERSGQRR